MHLATMGHSKGEPRFAFVLYAPAVGTHRFRLAWQAQSRPAAFRLSEVIHV